MSQLVQRFPGVSVFNIGDLLAQVRSVIDKAVTAVQSVFIFTLLAGLTVLLAAVQASRDERAYETAVLRVLGARRGMLVRSMLTEFSALGLVAGILASSGAALGGYLLAWQLELNYRFDPLAWVAGVVITVLIVGFGGWIATRGVIIRRERRLAADAYQTTPGTVFRSVRPRWRTGNYPPSAEVLTARWPFESRRSCAAPWRGPGRCDRRH
jgi:predicted lysophospholipase L1 biosynthesis ABC-type transport system permease subunit